ncbi:unnamed protein product [Brugia timori]|uniref:Glutathione S-transferase n=1 Tax=Brugia timori TaxID=42155 RepID=A0A0R3Q4A5_9BILA|nr:unnamed protein product [Brugia timori]
MSLATDTVAKSGSETSHAVFMPFCGRFEERALST